ncbi:MAG: adenine deaminase C-terminal domain-containing protein, partial [Thermodesulfobacteriota bacterium]|nr:adenine deaminase C-terminal domain-containing protein [Thermodesulfobacteriota bacterium]
AKDLEELLPLVNYRNSRRFWFVSDFFHGEDIHQRGHLDFILRKAVRLGMDPVTAVQLVTLNPAEYFGLKDRGAVAPGYRADLVVLNDLEDFEVASVCKDGQFVVDDGALVNYPATGRGIPFLQPEPLNIAPLRSDSFRIHHPGGRARVIELVPGQIVTRMLYEEVKSINGFVAPDVERDVLKLCVLERHYASGRLGLGLVRGFGLKQGAIASSVAHDSHNVIAVGVSDEEIFRAVEVIRVSGGGLAVVCGNETLAKTPLEVGGLMSRQPIGTLVRQLKEIKEAASRLGCSLDDCFSALSFLALPVIPELKLTDRGLVDVNQFEIVPLFLDKAPKLSRS